MDQTNKRYGRRTIIGDSFKRAKNRDRLWTWVCDCGSSGIGSLANIQTSISCGCFRGEELKNRCKTHGESKTGLYRLWASMHQRCSNPKRAAYRYYGGVGISVCARWKKYANFVADMPARPPGTTLDRINPYGNYGPLNCRWATAKEQNDSTRKRKFLK